MNPPSRRKHVKLQVRVIPGFAPLLFLPIPLVSLFSGHDPQDVGSRGTDSLSYGILVPATTTMVTAWDIPKNPLTDSTLDSSPRGAEIRWGYRLFMATPRETPTFARSNLSCGNCHLNAGQRERALPLVGVSHVYPEYNKREARPFTIEDRIIGCLMRSENGSETQESNFPATTSKEVGALASYISYISEGITRQEKLPWRGRNVIAPDSLIPVEKLDLKRGEELFITNCSACHGTDGQGVDIGDKKAGPLWGPASWNDGAGAARIYTLAGMIRYQMPYLNPGILTDAEAQEISAYINSKPRPAYPFKDKDYRVERVPPDAVYYTKRSP